MNDRAARKALGLRLRRAREYLGFTQDDAARVLGLHRPQISLLESGGRQVTALEFGRLAELYERSPSALLGHEPVAVTLSMSLQKELARLTDTDRAEVLRFAEFLGERARK